ncbi:hypothetical protein K402DRAFT_337065, partial [Aulographum hederae CBS 113979]
PLLPYHVGRTWTGGLPVYKLQRRGGNLHHTRIKHISGDIAALRRDLIASLGLPEERVEINSVNNHIMAKGFHVEAVSKFLKSKGF